MSDGQMEGAHPRGRIPLDFASILSVSHVPLLQDSPLSELMELLKRHPQDEPEPDHDLLMLVRKGVNSATLHLSKDYGQLYTFNEDWGAGRYFPTDSAIKSLISRASTMWVEADKYLLISSELRSANFAEFSEGLADEHFNHVVANATLDLSSRILKQFVGHDGSSS